MPFRFPSVPLFFRFTLVFHRFESRPGPVPVLSRSLPGLCRSLALLISVLHVFDHTLRTYPGSAWSHRRSADRIGGGGARTRADPLGGDGYDGNLRHFNINGNPVCNEGGMHLARMLLSNRTLQAVDFGNTQLGTEAVIALATVLKTQPFVEEINLDNPRLYSLEIGRAHV